MVVNPALTVTGIITVVNDEQFLNILIEDKKLFAVFKNTTCCKFIHDANATVPIVVTDAGKVIVVVNPVHPKKA